LSPGCFFLRGSVRGPRRAAQTRLSSIESLAPGRLAGPKTKFEAREAKREVKNRQRLYFMGMPDFAASQNSEARNSLPTHRRGGKEGERFLRFRCRVSC